ncbi:MAG: hypothetical protein E6J79_11965 [Deltaproteobacteria bacterium]|nr:MAG: hypothetical protein E6J79_11965 [Deltaproteobacteria bacterium]
MGLHQHAARPHRLVQDVAQPEYDARRLAQPSEPGERPEQLAVHSGGALVDDHQVGREAERCLAQDVAAHALHVV